MSGMTPSNQARDIEEPKEDVKSVCSYHSFGLDPVEACHSFFPRQRPPYLQDPGAIMGSIENHMIYHHQVREEKKHIPYNPTHRWWVPPLKAWFPSLLNRDIMGVMFVLNTLVVLVTRYTAICGDPSTYTYSNFCSKDWVFDSNTFLSALGVGLFLVLAFRGNKSYDRFWQGRQQWDVVKRTCVDLTRRLCLTVQCDTHEDAIERRRAVGFIASFAVTLKLACREEKNALPELSGFLCLQDILNIERAHGMPHYCIDMVTYYCQKNVMSKKFSDAQFSSANSTCFNLMIDTVTVLEAIRGTPLPLSYTLHLRFIMIFWLSFYPITLVPTYGWWTIFLAFLADYFVLGFESMSYEIEDPFGYDKNNLDLCHFCHGIEVELYEILRRVESQDKSSLFEASSVFKRNEEIVARTTAKERKVLGHGFNDEAALFVEEGLASQSIMFMFCPNHRSSMPAQRDLRASDSAVMEGTAMMCCGAV